MTRLGALALFITLLALGLANGAAAQSARVTMGVSAPRVGVGEPFVLEIRAEVTGGQLDDLEAPNLGSLEVLGERTSRPFSFSFGFGSGGNHAVMRSEVVRSFTLRAAAPGRVTFDPAIAVVSGRRIASRPVSIEILDTGATGPSATAPGVPPPAAASSAPAASGVVTPPEGPLDGAKFDGSAFLRTVVDKTAPTVGEQVTVTVFLYVRGSLGAVPTVTREPTANGFWIQDLLASVVPPPARQIVNGRTFSAYVLRRFAAFALKPGKLEIGAPAVEIAGGQSLFDLIAGPAEPITRSGVPVAIDVQPLPERAAKDAPFVVGDANVTASLDRTSAQVGEAVTLEVTISGHGNLKAIELAAPRVAGLEPLKPEVSDQLRVDQGVLGGTRSYRWLLLTRAPGHYTVPPFSIDVLNAESRTFTKQVSAPLVLDVSGVAAAAGSTPTPQVTPSEEPAAPWGSVRLSSALRRRTLPSYHEPWFWPLTALAPLVLLLTVLGLRFNQARAERFVRGGEERALTTAQRELASAEAALQNADAPAAASAMASALKRALEARLGEPIGGLTHGALRAHLLQRSMGAPLADRIISELTSCEQARFDPLGTSRGELSTLLEKCRGLLREIARFEAKAGDA